MDESKHQGAEDAAAPEPVDPTVDLSALAQSAPVGDATDNVDPAAASADANPQPRSPPTASLWESLASSSVAASDERPPTRFARVLEAVAWIVGVFAALFFARVMPILNGSAAASPERLGDIAGTLSVAVLIGVVARWFVVRARGRGRILSPWIMVVAVAVLVLNLGRQVPFPAPAAQPIASYLTIQAPYSLTTPTAEEADKLKAAIAGRMGAYEVRRVVQAGGELVGFLIIADLGAVDSDENRRALEKGFESNDGAQANQTTVGGRSAIVGTGSAGSAVLWVEPPYLISVYGIDEESARILAEAVMTSYIKPAS